MDQDMTEPSGERQERGPSPIPPRHPFPVRAVFIVLGTLFLGIAAVGIVLPILPTTPFVLLAAACYLRASTTLHQRLLRSRTFGPILAAWQEQRAIPARAKVTAIVMVIATFAISVVFVVEGLILQLGLAGLGAILVVWLARRPTWIPPATASWTHPE